MDEGFGARVRRLTRRGRRRGATTRAPERPKSLDGPGVQSSYLHNGTQCLFVTVTGEGRALFFAHGLFGTHTDAAWLTGIADRYALIAPDLRGRGASQPARAVAGHTFEAHAADALAILDYLRIDQAVVCGVSFGAAVAVAFALRHLERVAGLILIASAFGAAYDEMGEGDLDAYGDLAERIAAAGRDVVVEREVERTGSRRPRERWTQHDEASLVAFLRAVPLYRPFESIRDLASLTVPTLVVAGEDAIHTPELSAAYATALPDATEASGARRDEALRSFLGSIG